MYRDPDRRMGVNLLVLGLIATAIQVSSAGGVRLLDMWTLAIAAVGVALMVTAKKV
jgi:hypothetical protein